MADPFAFDLPLLNTERRYKATQLLEEVEALHSLDAKKRLKSWMTTDVILMAMNVNDVMSYAKINEGLLDSGSFTR